MYVNSGIWGWKRFKVLTKKLLYIIPGNYRKSFFKKIAMVTQGLLLHTACSSAFLPCSALGMFSHSTNFPFSLPLLCPFWQGREVRNRINCGRGCHTNSQSNKSPSLAHSHPSAPWEGR